MKLEIPPSEGRLAITSANRTYYNSGTESKKTSHKFKIDVKAIVHRLLLSKYWMGHLDHGKTSCVHDESFV